MLDDIQLLFHDELLNYELEHRVVQHLYEHIQFSINLIEIDRIDILSFDDCKFHLDLHVIMILHLFYKLFLNRK